MRDAAQRLIRIFFIIFVIIPFAPISIPLLLVLKFLEKNETEETSNEVLKPQKPKYDYCYESTYLLTRNEYREYKKLKHFADQNNLLICPKVRLADIVRPKNGEDYMILFSKIKSKHVDFVITDKDLYIKAILELDDNSHNTPERAERDQFVNEVLTNVGYTVIRTRSVTETTLDPILKTELQQESKAQIEEVSAKGPEPEVKLQRKEMTYEEWKASRQAQQ